MAKFGSYFGLCPLIDQRSLLGISEDSESDNVIVTLGKNMAMIYTLVDQKQIISWNTKEKFSSPVIFDVKTEKYVAVFNHLFIKCWTTENSNLDKVKKSKFKSNIDTIIVTNSTSFVIFKTGDIVSLEYALSNHKSFTPEEIINQSEEYIVNNISYSLNEDKYIGLIVGNSNSKAVSHLLWTSFDCIGNKSEYSKVTLRRNECRLIGYCFQLLNQQIQFISVWSDGKFYVKSLEEHTEDLGEVFCVIELFSYEYPLSTVSLDEDHLAIYGSNSDQEGSLLIIYNMQFKVTQCIQSFKLQSMGVKLYKIHEKLLLPIGQNLAVVPYHLEKEQLSALVGSHSNTGDDITLVPLVEEPAWISCVVSKPKNNEAETLIKDYLDRGYPESMIFEELLPEYIEKNNIMNLKILLKNFTDIPENCLTKVLSYILELPKKKFKNKELVKNKFYPDELQPLERYECLKLVLEKHEYKVFWKSNEENVSNLLKFILYLLKHDPNTTDKKFYIRLIQWVHLIMSANFALLLGAQNGLIVEILSSYSELKDKVCSISNDELQRDVENITKRKKITNDRKSGDSDYKIVKISF